MPKSYSIIKLNTVDSTNNYAKRLDVKELPCVIISDTQTAGRGRLGRSFISPAGTGIYMSIVLLPESVSIDQKLITVASAVAVRRAIIKVTNAEPKIKWVNDLYLNNKKISGILTEMPTEINSGKADRIIIGIGVNCFPGSFPDELNDIAGCISDIRDSFSMDALSREIADEVFSILSADCVGSYGSGTPKSDSILNEYRDNCFILGKEITATDFTNQKGSPKIYSAKALDISSEGELIVQRLDSPNHGEIVNLFSGEVSINFD